MLIGELARRAGTTVRALRYYEQEGLLVPRRAPNGYREYDDPAVTRVANIRLLLSFGLTARDIRAFVPCLDQDLSGASLCSASARVLTRRLTAVDRRIAALGTVRGRLLEALERTGAPARG